MARSLLVIGAVCTLLAVALAQTTGAAAAAASTTPTTRTTTPRTTTRNLCVLPNCLRCNTTNLAQCTRCNPPTILHQGACVQACPLTHSPSNTSTTSLRSCVVNFCTGNNCPPAPAPCVRRFQNCSSCRTDNFLLDGRCLTSCPPGYRVSNTTSLYRRRCVPRDCRSAFTNCHECDPGLTRCTMCRNNHSLHEGHCLAACPPGTVARGTGSFRRTCLTLPRPVSCTVGQNKCSICGLGPNRHRCLQCTDSHYLLNGVCLAQCPVSTIPVTPGVDGSVCKY
jgi:hypothetical protein